MNIKIEINTDGEAFEGVLEENAIADILEEYAQAIKILGFELTATRLFYKESRCGTVTITEESE